MKCDFCGKPWNCDCHAQCYEQRGHEIAQLRAELEAERRARVEAEQAWSSAILEATGYKRCAETNIRYRQEAEERVEKAEGQLIEQEVTRKGVMARLSEVCDDWDKIHSENVRLKEDLAARDALIVELRKALLSVQYDLPDSDADCTCDECTGPRRVAAALALTPAQAGERMRLMAFLTREFRGCIEDGHIPYTPETRKALAALDEFERGTK